MYIVLEKHGGWPHAAIVTDHEGNVKVFDELKCAEDECAECQEGVIVGDDETGVLIGQLLSLIDNGLLALSGETTEEQKQDFETLKHKLRNHAA